MVGKSISTTDVHKILDKYDMENITIVTAASHSALPLIYGAKKEGFKTALVCTDSRRKKVYQSFQAAQPDEIIEIDGWDKFLSEKVQEELIRRNGIIIPHGSFVEYIGAEKLIHNCKVPQFGNRYSLEWEYERARQRAWLEGMAGLEMPKEYNIEEIEEGKLAIVKFSGAKGGRGFFKIRSKKEVPEVLEELVKAGVITEEDAKDEKRTIQQYIAGSRYYHHFFFSPLNKKDEWQVRVEGRNIGRLELNGMDRRDETNIDDIHRTGLNPAELKEAGIWPTYTVCGNIPLYLRESLLPDVLEAGDKTVKASLDLFPPGIIGPFCLETFCTSDLKFVTFEISARIVAGTSIYARGSPYAVYDYGAEEEMSMARRIAREIKIAIGSDKLKEVIV